MDRNAVLLLVAIIVWIILAIVNYVIELVTRQRKWSQALERSMFQGGALLVFAFVLILSR